MALLFRRSLGRGTRRPPLLVLAAALGVAAIAVLVVTGSALAPFDPTRQDLMLSAAGPGNGHWLGTDMLGRDVFSQLIAATRGAVIGPLCVALAAALVGVPLGLAAGYRGGVFDTVANRLADLLYALPAMLVIIVAVGVAGGGYWFAVAVLTLLTLPAELRFCRSAALVQARLPYVEAARVLGLSAPRIMFRHLLPNILPTVIATLLLDFVGALISLSGLSYLGLGAPPGTPDWGQLLNQGQSLLTINPYLSLAPAIMIIITAVSVTLLGDWMYERYTSSADAR